ALDNAFFTNPANQNNMRMQWGNKSGIGPDNIVVMGYRSDTNVPARFHLMGSSAYALNSVGIWDIYLHHFEIDYGAFTDCCTQPGPGDSVDGIRFEWPMVSGILRHCLFAGNIMGFQLSGASGPGASLLIEYCEFYMNGVGPFAPGPYGTGQTHNLYVDAIDTFTFRYNLTWDSDIGHLFKTRAQHNFIYDNYFID